MPAPVITLATDYGPSSAYVAILKATLLRHCPEAKLVDLAHDLAGDDPFEAAFLLRRVYSYYPAGTVHLVGIDRGETRALAVSADEQRFLAMDNGVLGLVLEREAEAEVFDLTVMEPSTFLARDLLAPIAAQLALGVAAASFGNPIEDWRRLNFPQPQRRADGLHGEVVHVDRFGNLVTNFASPPARADRLPRLRIGGQVVTEWRANYAGRAGVPFLLRGAEGWVEVSVAGGSAAALLQVGRGAAAVLG